MNAINWFLGLDGSSHAIDRLELFVAAPWVRESPFWLVLLLAGVLAGAIYYYRRFQSRGRLWVRTGLGCLRGGLLALLVCTLANPYLRLHVQEEIPAKVYLLFDGTQSMLTRDVDDSEGAIVGRDSPTRLQAVQTFLGDLSERMAGGPDRGLSIEAYQFDGLARGGLRKIQVAGASDANALSEISGQLSATGEVTALGGTLIEFAQRFAQPSASAVLVFSDFANNSGSLPTSDESLDALRNLGIPLYAVGVGRTRIADVTVSVQVESRLKNEEETSLSVTLAQTDLLGRPVDLTVYAGPVSAEPSVAPEVVDRRRLVLSEESTELSFKFTPRQTGAWEFRAKVEPVPGEFSDANNTATTRSDVIDDFMRLLYVAEEPNWEWRFVKEAFHRDSLVGIDGFRTYLQSSDALVRRDNVLFLESVPTRREQLFRNDVVILDDVSEAVLVDEFCELVEEFVGKLGGGLVVLAGPRFGVRALEGTALESILPVRIGDPTLERRDRTFVGETTAYAPSYAFMNLGDEELRDEQVWGRLRLPWYQPVVGVHDQASVLLEHPEDRSSGGAGRQPVVAARRYGRGEVLFVATNELWRLRRGYGERYHRRWWSQLIYRLGMSHALGDDKRFVVRTDRTSYRTEEVVTLTVDAFDSDYQPLALAQLSGAGLEATVALRRAGSQAAATRRLIVPWREPGVFEVSFPVSQPGEYTVGVTDPIGGGERQAQFTVTAMSGERSNPVRDEQLQEELAAQTGGKSYELATASRLIEDLPLDPVNQHSVRTRPLWSTPLWFSVVVGLMLSEWLIRRLLQMA